MSEKCSWYPIELPITEVIRFSLSVQLFPIGFTQSWTDWPPTSKVIALQRSLVHFWKSQIWFFVYLRSSMSAEFENDIFPVPTEMKPASQINMCLIFFLTCQRWSISWLSKCHIMNTKTLFFLKYSSAWHLKIHRKRKSPMTEGEVKNFWQFFYFCSRHGNNMAFLDVTLWWTI